MSDRVSPLVRVRAIRGRTVDPFRGTPGDDDERLASRPVDAQPIDDVAATMQRLPGVKVARAGRRFTLGRGHDVMKVAFASAARRVSLDDATFEGDGDLVITVLHALLPLFGAVEVRIGAYSDLIDGHEPLSAVLDRYGAWWIEETMKLAKAMKERDAGAARAAAAAAAPPIRPPTNVRPAPRKATRKVRVAFAAVMVVLAGGLAIGMCKAQNAGVGEYCTKNDDCDSEQCLPREPISSYAPYGVPLGQPAPPSDPSGVCTQRCSYDSDCPADMACGDAISYGGLIKLATRTKRCMPRAWQ